MQHETSFSTFHPWVNLVYYILAIGITMFSLSPGFLLVSLGLAFTYSVFLRGRKTIRMNLLIILSLFLIMGVINTLFSHNGATVLFYIRGMRITLQAFIFGLSAAAMVAAVVMWFLTFHQIVTSEKLIFLFGKALPVLGLTLSMIFRYIPLLKSRMQEIRMGQICMGRNNQTGLIKKIRQFGKEVSILVSWSLESSIETADSMEARGYGLKGRTSFHLYRFTRRDLWMLLLLLGLGAFEIAGGLSGRMRVDFYPYYHAARFDWLSTLLLIAYLLLLSIPLLLEASTLFRAEKKLS